MKRILFSLAVVFILAISGSAQDDRAAGVKAFNTGDFVGSVALLRRVVKANEKDADAWFVLGMSHLKMGKNKEAAKALQRSVDLTPQNDKFLGFLAYAYAEVRNSKAAEAAQSSVRINPKNAVAQYVLGVLAYRNKKYPESRDHASMAIEADPGFGAAFRLRSLASIADYAGMSWKGSEFVIKRAELLREAVSDLETMLSKTTDQDSRKYAEADLIPLRYFAEYYTRPENMIPNDPSTPPNPAVTPLKVLRKDSSDYTESARRNNVEGTLTLFTAFEESGKMGHIIVLKSLNPGLDYNAVQAAKKIRFEPAKRDGKSISQVRRLEYSFRFR